MPSAAGERRSPRCNAALPCIRSSPARRRLSPRRSTLAGKRTWSPSTKQNSCGITVSRPAGIMAPVMILTASPGPSVPRQAAPASAVPTTRRLTEASLDGSAGSCAPSKAKPSIAELSCGGTLTGEMMSSASTRPSASRSAIRSDCVTTAGSASRARKACTASTPRAFGS